MSDSVTIVLDPSLAIVLDPSLVAAIESYLDADWSKVRDPSRLGALNAVAHIGECVAAIYAAQRIAGRGDLAVKGRS